MTIKTLRAAMAALSVVSSVDPEDCDVLADGRVITGFRVEGYLPDDVLTLDLLTDQDKTDTEQRTESHPAAAVTGNPFGEKTVLLQLTSRGADRLLVLLRDATLDGTLAAIEHELAHAINRQP